MKIEPILYHLLHSYFVMEVVIKAYICVRSQVFSCDGFVNFKNKIDIPSSALKMEAAVFSETCMFTCRSLLGMDKWRFRASRQ